MAPVPFETSDDEIQVVIERNHLVAGVRGQSPIIKVSTGQLYGNVDTASSVWLLEPRASRLSPRERTTSTTSTGSYQSSYAFVSDPDISSSFAASLDSGPTSDTEDQLAPSPVLSSPVSSSADERAGFAQLQRHQMRQTTSRMVSPHNAAISLASSFSSMESLQASKSGRLLTLHLEKADSVIWPSLIVGSAPEALSPCTPSPVGLSHNAEQAYNMDPTSLVLLAFDLLDIRQDKEAAFEYLLRAWHQAHLPSAAVRLVTHFVPLHLSFDDTEMLIEPGTTNYYMQCLGGLPGLAQLYLEAGLLHLEGTASVLLSTSYSPLSSLRLPSQPQHGDSMEGGTAAWKRDREIARRYFQRAQILHPSLDVPLLPPEGEDTSTDTTGEIVLQMPIVEVNTALEKHASETRPRQRRRQREEVGLFDPERTADDIDNTWYLADTTRHDTYDIRYDTAFYEDFDALWNSICFMVRILMLNVQTEAYIESGSKKARALIILNQPFSETLLQRLWQSTSWHCCADGGANRLFDLFSSREDGEFQRADFIPDLVKGDLDSLRDDVRKYYASKGVSIVQDHDQDSTDLMKCIFSLQDKERAEGKSDLYDIVLLGGLSGRLDQTIHTLSYLHKMRKSGRRVFAVTDENIGWVLDEGEHYISIPHSVLGPTCGLLPVGVDSTILSTRGLRWNLSDCVSGFDRLMSTSNHLVPGEDVVWVKTSRPIWWSAELRKHV
ncbi:hypothetical protein EW146_g8628 [Bondarzewia mesenterica]|uniref:Thiamin pyrophosphokinase thiamin-binding domain-containing protein n=1 Tax=Bondarzewia mesenterica TaxID=1095465 RepID=A0A4S4LIG2_9AGAM|nr:hypothetical protein EW146_g8628 [Bondarzewia mesenterica]